MAEATGIAWTDSTFNSWWGCTKVGPPCDHCYAEGVDKRTGENHWGPDAPRRHVSQTARNEPFRWQKKADAFRAEHGRDRRVFTLSMGDLFDKEVPEDWRIEHMHTMELCDRLRWQICTKRIGLLARFILPAWKISWPQHVGVMITCGDQKDANRDIPKLLEAKSLYRIPWVGISYEPALGPINFNAIHGERTLPGGSHEQWWESALSGKRFDPWSDGDIPAPKLDWIICGGESGKGWRPMDLDWARAVRDQCAKAGTAFFFKQVSAFRPSEDMIPEDLRIRQFPEALR